MKTILKHRGFFTGIFCSIVSVCLTVTYVLPVVLAHIGIFISDVYVFLFRDENLERRGAFTIIVLIILLVIVLFLWRRYLTNFTKEGNTISIVGIVYVLLSFTPIIHPLAFFIYSWYSKSFFNGFAYKGIWLVGAIISFPFSSLSYMFLGLLVDYFSKYYAVTSKNGS